MNEYTTTDLGEAAYLLLTGHPLVRLDGRLGKRTFVFNGTSREAGTEFFNGAKVEARSYAATIRDLKARILRT